MSRHILKHINAILPIALFLAGVAMMSLGILRGELVDIMRKGIVVCLECIGIG